MSNLVVQTNVLALNSHRNLRVIGQKQFTASGRLSSGYRINSAADDAAGLAISEKMRAQIRGLDMASKNTQDGSSLVQTAEGGMQEIDNMLQRIRELIVYASNDTNENNSYGTGDRQKIQDEIDQLTQEIDSMAERVEFNKKKVINGQYADAGIMYAQAAATAGSWDIKATTLSTQYSTASATYIATSNTLNILSTNVSTTKSTYLAAIGNGGEAAAKAAYDAAQGAYNDGIKALALDYNQMILKSTAYGKASTSYSIAADRQTYWSGAWAAQDGVVGLYFQIGANADQGMVVTIGGMKTDILGIGDGNGKSSLDVKQDTGIEITGALDILDIALSYVTTERSRLGAVQNRMEYTKSSLDISSENLSASESRIRDADMAKEMMKLTAANVLQQAGVSMLAQANQSPQSVLQLLR